MKIARFVGLVSAVFCFCLSPLSAQKLPEEFRAEASYDSNSRELVIKVTAIVTDISVAQLSISRPYADEAGIRGNKDFIPYVGSPDQSDTKAARDLTDKANKKVCLYRGNLPIGTNQTKEIRLSAEKAPNRDCRIVVGADLVREGHKFGVYLDANLR